MNKIYTTFTKIVDESKEEFLKKALKILEKHYCTLQFLNTRYENYATRNPPRYDTIFVRGKKRDLIAKVEDGNFVYYDNMEDKHWDIKQKFPIQDKIVVTKNDEEITIAINEFPKHPRDLDFIITYDSAEIKFVGSEEDVEKIWKKLKNL